MAECRLSWLRHCSVDSRLKGHEEPAYPNMNEAARLIRGNELRGAGNGQRLGGCVLIKLYAHPVTVNCRKVLAGLDLISAPFDLMHVDYLPVGIRNLNSLPSIRTGHYRQRSTVTSRCRNRTRSCNTPQTFIGRTSIIPRTSAQAARRHPPLDAVGSRHWSPSCYVYLVENVAKPLLFSAARRRSAGQGGAQLASPGRYPGRALGQIEVVDGRRRDDCRHRRRSTHAHARRPAPTAG